MADFVKKDDDSGGLSLGDIIFGGLAIIGTGIATAATLGAFAPAAAATDAAVVGGAAGAGAAGGAAAAVPVAAAVPDVVSGASAVAADAAPVITDAAPAAAAASAPAAGAAPDVISGASAVAADDAPFTAGQTTIDEVSGAGPTSTTIDEVHAPAAAGKVGKAVGTAMKEAKQVYDSSRSQQQAFQRPVESGGPDPSAAPTPGPQLETPNLVGPLGSQYGAIFGSPQVGKQPLRAPSLAIPPIAPTQPQPMMMPQMSDRTQKTNVKQASRSIKDFLAQVYSHADRV